MEVTAARNHLPRRKGHSFAIGEAKEDEVQMEVKAKVVERIESTRLIAHMSLMKC